MAVLDVEALSALRKANLRARQEAVSFATQGVEEFPLVARQIEVPFWDPDPALQKYHRDAGFTKGYVLLRNDDKDEFWLTQAFGAVVGSDGIHLLRNDRATPAKLGSWVASACGFNIDAIGRVFTLALTDVPLGTSQV